MRCLVMGGNRYIGMSLVTELGLAAGYRDSYEWLRVGGRDRYELDFSEDDRILSLLV